MSWSDKVVMRILLLVAKMIAREDWKKEIEQLSSHIQYGDREKKE